MILYKYKSINEYTKEALQLNQIYYPNPNSLNDPFDCKSEIYSNSFGMNAEDLINAQLVTSFIHYHTHFKSSYLSEPKKKHLFNEIKKAKNSRAAVDVIQRFYKSIGINYTLLTLKERYKEMSKQINSFGILSLTEDPVNMLMWSHYGDQHKGIVLGIEIDEEESCKQVEYKNEFPKIDMSLSNAHFSMNFQSPENISREYTIELTDQIINDIFYHKAECWNYEKEWRIINQKFGLANYPGKLVEVIFGCRCSDSDKIAVKRCITDTNVKYKEIITSNNSFTLFIK